MGKVFHIKNISVSLLKASLFQPFRTALGTHHTLKNVLFILELSDGTKGYGEAAIATHITGETVDETNRNLKAIGPSLIGRKVSEYLKISKELHERLSKNKAAVAAVEMALLDAFTRCQPIPLWKFFGPKPQRLVTDITIVIADLKETEESVERYYAQGFRTFKVKIGRDMDLDIKRVLAVKRLAPKGTIYLDANQGYASHEILKFLNLLENKKIHPSLIEQPVPKEDWEGLKRVARSTKVPVCADESIRSLEEAKRAMKEKAVTVINIKLMKYGVFQACTIARLARAAGLHLMMGGMMETSLAMTAAAHLASGLGCFKYIDLDTPFFIRGEVAKNPYLNSKGLYDLKRVKGGIGIIP